MKPKAVIFDCDGVIVDSERQMMELFHSDLTRFGMKVDFDELVEMNLGGAVPQFVPRMQAMGIDVPEDWVEDFYARLYAILEDHTPLIDGIEPVLAAVQAAGLQMAIGSNGRHEKMHITLGHHPGVMDVFRGQIYSGQALGKLKPAPDLYLHIADALGQKPADCVVIEDSPNGARAAVSAGMRCFGYAGNGHGSQLAAVGAITFGSMDQLPALLGLQPYVG